MRCFTFGGQYFNPSTTLTCKWQKKVSETTNSNPIQLKSSFFLIKDNCVRVCIYGRLPYSKRVKQDAIQAFPITLRALTCLPSSHHHTSASSSREETVLGRRFMWHPHCWKCLRAITGTCFTPKPQSLCTERCQTAKWNKNSVDKMFQVYFRDYLVCPVLCRG